jgi:hypothetical protein
MLMELKPGSFGLRLPSSDERQTTGKKSGISQRG